MANIISPTVDLFVYDLRKELGQTLEEIQENRENFAKKLPPTFRSSLWQEDNQFETEFIELLGEKVQVEPLAFSSQEYQGYYYPVRLQDIYGLLLDCTVKNKSFSYPASCIAKAKQLLEEAIQAQTATLGRSWMVSGQLAYDSLASKDSELLAQECYQALIPNGNWQENLQSKNDFLGGTIFELSRHQLRIPEALDDFGTDLLSFNNHHVIIAIYPDRETAVTASYYIADWMRLWCYRHKILWSYRQSRFLKQLLEGDLIEIQNYVQQFKQEDYRISGLYLLEQSLEQAGTLFSSYGIDLNYLKTQICTLEVNLHDYCQQIEIMKNNLKVEGELANLSFLDKFSQQAKSQYLWKIQKEYESLHGGLTLLEVAINLLRAEVEVSQVKHHRNGQEAIATIGVGVGSGVAAAAIASHLSTAEEQEIQAALNRPIAVFLGEVVSVPSDWILPTMLLSFSLCAALVAGGVTGLILWFRRPN